MGSDSEYIWNHTFDLFNNFKEVTYQPHSIPSVPDEFRKLNNGNDYIPKVFSIGPRHRGRSELQAAEVIKSHYINSLFNRLIGKAFIHRKELIEKCKRAIIGLDGVVRKIYTNDINLDRYELATVMLYDGSFLLELLLSNDTHSTLKGSEYLVRDLLLLENQIPFVILETLYNTLIQDSEMGKVDDDTRKTSIIENIRKHALSFFGISHAISSSTNNNNFYNAYHLLDIVYLHVKTQWPEEEDEEEEERQHVIDTTEHHGGGLKAQHLNRCATTLEAVGITIRVRPLNNNNNENSTAAAAASSSSKKCIAFKSSIFEFFKHNVKFNKSNGILEIPQLVITPTTELLPIWKNFIAWENHNNNLKRSDHFMGQRSERFLISKTGRDNVFTSSALLFNDLICCPSDVQLLKNKKIIVDHSSKSNRDLIDLFQSNICGVDRDAIIDPLYATMFHQSNTYSSPMNYAIKHIILLPHYFSRILEWIYNLRNFFSRGYNFVAAMVTFLTVVQTCYAIVAYHHPKT